VFLYSNITTRAPKHYKNRKEHFTFQLRFFYFFGTDVSTRCPGRAIVAAWAIIVNILAILINQQALAAVLYTALIYSL
jgi:hypothetical protein